MNYPLSSVNVAVRLTFRGRYVKDNLSCQTGSEMVLNRLGCSVVPFVSRQID